MEKEVLMKAMRASISEVLEKMFFLPIEFGEDADPAELWAQGGRDLLCCRLTYKGPLSGHFVFSIPGDLAHSLAEDFLGGGGEDVTREHVQDTVKEITNMIAGNTFSILDSNAVFDLGIPELVPFSDSTTQTEGVFVVIKTFENNLALQMVLG